jgi:ferrous iron transport protein A
MKKNSRGRKVSLKINPGTLNVNVAVDKPLLDFPSGTVVEIVGFEAGRGLKQRLLALGLVPGAVVYLMEKNHGPVRLCINNTRLALGRGVAAKVRAREAVEEPDVACGADDSCPRR